MRRTSSAVCAQRRAGRRHVCIHTKGVGVNRDGAFADFVVIPAGNVWVQPDDLDPDLGAVFDPSATPPTPHSFPMAGEDVVITGAGPIGVMAAAIARHVGARHVVVTDISDYRLEPGEERRRGPRGQCRPQRPARGDGRARHEGGFDIGLEMSGVPSAVEDMLANMNHGGRVAMLGLPKDPFPIDWGRVITHMITIKGIYGREMYDTLYAMSRCSRPHRSCASVSRRSSPTASRREVAGRVRRGPPGRGKVRHGLGLTRAARGSCRSHPADPTPPSPHPPTED